MDITESQFKEYERVRRSGLTNMFDLFKVSKLSGLNAAVIKCIMNDYDALETKYMEEKS